MTRPDAFYQDLFAFTADPAAPCVDSRYTVGDIQGLAVSLLERLRPFAQRNQAICLWTEDRGFLMAAVLAALAGGPVIALPHAFSIPVLKELQEVSPFAGLLSDRGEAAFPGLERIAPPEFHPAAAMPEPVRRPDEIFMKLFTGGSTGTPRIWEKTPAGLLGEAAFLARRFEISRKDILLATVPPQHIYGLLFSVLLPFLSGARILQESFVFPREIIAGIARHRATILISVPLHYHALRTDALERFTLRRAFSSAGKVKAEDARHFREKTGLPITEIFGSTETGGIAVQDSPDDQGRLTPFPVVTWKIDQERLCVRSPFLSGDLPRDQDGFFVTGDRVASLGPECFKLLGRADEIVKVAGKRVDLAEIREKILLLPGMEDALVLTLPEIRGRRLEIVALVVGSLDREEIRQRLAEILESYALPRRILPVESIPATPTGKIDRRRIEELLNPGEQE